MFRTGTRYYVWSVNIIETHNSCLEFSFFQLRSLKITPVLTVVVLKHDKLFQKSSGNISRYPPVQFAVIFLTVYT